MTYPRKICTVHGALPIVVDVSTSLRDLTEVKCSENSLLWRSSYVQYSLMHFDQINRVEMNCMFKNLLHIDRFVRR